MSRRKYNWVTAKSLYCEGDNQYPDGVPPKEISKRLEIPLPAIYKQVHKDNWNLLKKEIAINKNPNGSQVSVQSGENVLKNLTDIYSGMVELTNQILEDAKNSDDIEEKLRAINVLGSTGGMSKVLKDIQILETERRKNEMKKSTEIPDNWEDMTLEELESYINKDDSKMIDVTSRKKKK